MLVEGFVAGAFGQAATLTSGVGIEQVESHPPIIYEVLALFVGDHGGQWRPSLCDCRRGYAV